MQNTNQLKLITYLITLKQWSLCCPAASLAHPYLSPKGKVRQAGHKQAAYVWPTASISSHPTGAQSALGSVLTHRRVRGCTKAPRRDRLPRGCLHSILIVVGAGGKGSSEETTALATNVSSLVPTASSGKNTPQNKHVNIYKLSRGSDHWTGLSAAHHRLFRPWCLSKMESNFSNEVLQNTK